MCGRAIQQRVRRAYSSLLTGSDSAALDFPSKLFHRSCQTCQAPLTVWLVHTVCHNQTFNPLETLTASQDVLLVTQLEEAGFKTFNLKEQIKGCQKQKRGKCCNKTLLCVKPSSFHHLYLLLFRFDHTRLLFPGSTGGQQNVFERKMVKWEKTLNTSEKAIQQRWHKKEG